MEYADAVLTHSSNSGADRQNYAGRQDDSKNNSSGHVPRSDEGGLNVKSGLDATAAAEEAADIRSTSQFINWTN